MTPRENRRAYGGNCDTTPAKMPPVNIATWKSLKSPVMKSIRLALKKKAAPGEPTPSRKEANRTWREDFLGVLSEEDKKKKAATRREPDRPRHPAPGG